MSESGSEALRRTISTHFLALHKVSAHIYRRFGFFQIAYERVLVPRTFVRVLPWPIRSVRFVCKENRCRSPSAEVYCLGEAQNGSAHDFRRVYGVSKRNQKDRRTRWPRKFPVSKKSHRKAAATSLYRKLVEQLDLALLMEVAQRDRMMARCPKEWH